LTERTSDPGDRIILCGADEAGRGALLGPLVVSIVAVKQSSIKRLSDIGVRDSKLLSAKRRSRIYNEIMDIAEDARFDMILPSEINDAMANRISLNELEAKHFSSLFDQINLNVHTIYLDSPDVIPERFGERFGMYSTKPTRVSGIKSAKRPAGVEFTRVVAEHKADVRYPVVSAASIIAKVARDAEIERLERKLRIKIGSGYPSDAETIEMIRANLGNPKLDQHIRNRWATLEKIRQRSILDY
jgi:ribonuclease HII